MYNRKIDDGERSLLFDSPLYSYIVAHDGDIISDCLDAFENECAALLRLSKYSDTRSISKFEMIRPFILKVLLYLGIRPLGEKFALLIRLIEILAVDHDVNFEKAIEFCAISCGSTDRVARAVESEINMYDATLIDKLETITDTSPLTPRDAIYDIAQYVRNEYFGKNKYHA